MTSPKKNLPPGKCSLAIAEAWFQALEPLLVETDTAVSLSQLHTLTQRLLSLITKSPLDAEAMQLLGCDIAHQCGVHPAILSTTQQLFAHQLIIDLSHEQIDVWQPHLQIILNELAAGFVLELCRAARQPIKAALQESEAWFRAIVATATDGIITIDDQHQLFFVNPAVEEIFGYRASELIGKNLDYLLPERFQARHMRFVQNYGETGVTIRSMQRQKVVYGRHASGREFPIEVAISQVNLNGQKYFTAILRDATERKRTEDALQRTQKLESLGIFASGIAHDFNNLLVALMAESEAALLKLLPDQPARQNIQHIIHISERGASLTQQLLAYSSEGKNQIISFDFNKLVTENREFLKAMLPKNIALKLNLAADLPSIEAVAGQIQQVIMNLIINAAEAYQGQDGSLEIETQLVIIGPPGFWEEANQQVHPGKYICLRVQDRGQGMDAATLARIFDPFFTTKFDGRGLGLAAVQGIIHNHRGTIHVTSQIGQGTTFHVLLPVGDAPIPVEKAIRQKLHTQTGQILFIDDEETVRCAITEILELSGYTVLQAEDGSAGLMLFQQHDDEINLILLDMTMPIMAGDEVLQAIRYTHPNMPVLLLSGYDETEKIKQAAATRFLKKPFKVDSLLAHVSELLS